MRCDVEKMLSRYDAISFERILKKKRIVNNVRKMKQCLKKNDESIFDAFADAFADEKDLFFDNAIDVINCKSVHS